METKTTVIVSITAPEKIAHQVRLLAKLEGVTISAIFLAGLGDVPERLKTALAAASAEVA